MSNAPQKWWYVFDEPTRILVVDDDPILREFASVYLTTPMSQVVLAPDAATALDLLAREAFDIAMIDIEMPGMNGFELVDFRELFAPLDADEHEYYDDPPVAWAKQWPAEEIWRLRLRRR